MSKILEYVKTAFWIMLLIQFIPPVYKTVSHLISSVVEPKNKVGYIVLNSVITSSTSINKQLKKFFKDPEIKAILIKMDCPGGAAGSCEAINQEIMELKKQYPKPIVTYCENICASGGYLISVATDYIITTSGALIGSIGSKISTQFKLQELLAKYDVKTHSFAGGAYKNSLDMFVPMNEDQQKMMQELVDTSYNEFAAIVAQQRHLNIAQKSVWADGKIFTGSEAVKLKLVDSFGNQSTAIALIKQRILHADREIELVKAPTPSRLMKILYPEKDEDDQELEQSVGSFVSRCLMHISSHSCLS